MATLLTMAQIESILSLRSQRWSFRQELSVRREIVAGYRRLAESQPAKALTVIKPDGHQVGRCEGEVSFKAFLGASDDPLRKIHSVAPVTELDGDEIGYLVGKVAKIKR